MGKLDTEAKAYMSNPKYFSDAFNFWLYNGKQIIKPEALKELDTTAIALPYNEKSKASVQKFRDILKLYAAKKDNRAIYLILGLELQAKTHYAMPVRNMLYDAMNYAKQVSDTAAKHRENGDELSKEEFLTGFKKNDKLVPVITLTINLNSEPWDAPMSIHEMIDVENKELLQYIPNYKLNLLTPAQIVDKDFDKFQTELGAVLQFIKHRGENNKEWMRGNKRFQNMHRDTANLIETITGIKFNFSEKGEVVNMWVAYENDIKQARDDGHLEGIETARKEIALTMFADNLPIDRIAKYSQLSVQDATALGKAHGYL